MFKMHVFSSNVILYNLRTVIVVLVLVLVLILVLVLVVAGSQDSAVSIATRYVLEGPGIESWWGSFSAPFQTGSGAHPASCTMGTGSFPGVKAAGV
jgi:hypothetical protein